MIPGQGANLLIHMGGLGDVCLSESTFLSLNSNFYGDIHALGNLRFLTLFKGYFRDCHSIESARWLFLFAETKTLPQKRYKRVIFIGKDLEGRLRERFQRFSEEDLVFIDMYPDTTRLNVEDYQLMQLKQYGIIPMKKGIEKRESRRIILYPEKGFKKHKWPVENFLLLFERLKQYTNDIVVLQQHGLELNVENKVYFEHLYEIKDFFNKGGIFISNDSGMAHLAGACGLTTISIFSDFDPVIWRSRGYVFPLKVGAGLEESICKIVIERLNRLTEKDMDLKKNFEAVF